MALLFSEAASAQSLAVSARQLEPGTWKLIPYYQGTQAQDLKFSVGSSGPCAGGLTPPGSNAVFPCGSAGDVKAHADAGLGMVKLLAQPWDHTQYYVAGGAGGLTLRLPGGQVLSSKRTGWAFAGGGRAVIVPDTIVGPAIALDLSFGMQRFEFDEVRPAATANAGQISQRLDLQQLQVAVEASHRFDLSDPKLSLEPYGGVKWLRTQSWLLDNQLGGQIGGIQHTYTPFIGLQVPVFERETLFAEASFVDGVQYSAGAHIRFK